MVHTKCTARVYQSKLIFPLFYVDRLPRLATFKHCDTTKEGGGIGNGEQVWHATLQFRNHTQSSDLSIVLNFFKRAVGINNGRLKNLVDSGLAFLITEFHGLTDIVFENPQGIGYSEPLTPGTWSIFPPMGINFYPLNANGIFVPDETTIHGRPLAPIKFTVSNGYVTDVEAGAESDVAAVDSYANGKYYLRHSVIGLNPKTRTFNAPQFERERAAGMAYLGVDGTGPDGIIDRNKAGRAHLDAIFDTPNIYIDDKIMVDRRKLLILEDEELLELAKEYGEPRRILAQNPFIW